MSKISSVSSFNNDIRRRPIVVAGAAGSSRLSMPAIGLPPAYSEPRSGSMAESGRPGDLVSVRACLTKWRSHIYRRSETYLLEWSGREARRLRRIGI